MFEEFKEFEGKIKDSQYDDLVKILDVDGNGEIIFEELQKFIQDYKGNFSLGANLTSLLGRKGLSGAAVFSDLCGIPYKLTKADYLREGCTTIVNSETAALALAEQLFKDMPQGERFFDKDFGPKDKKDLENSRISLYATGEAPPGYVKPEQIVWLDPHEICPD